jgi:hypothetical protein
MIYEPHFKGFHFGWLYSALDGKSRALVLIEPQFHWMHRFAFFLGIFDLLLRLEPFLNVIDAKQVLMYIGCSTTVQTTHMLSIGAVRGIEASIEFMPMARARSIKEKRLLRAGGRVAEI